MSTNSDSRRPTRRYENRSRKMAPNVDLIYPSVESRIPVGTSVPARSRAPQRTVAVPVNPRRGLQPAAAVASGGLVSSPIDVEAIEDDVQMLSSPTGFPQARNQSRRNRPLMVVLDEDPETHHPGHSVVSIEDSAAALLSLNSHNKRQRIPLNRTIINAELYSACEDDCNAKRKKSAPEPAKVVPEEPIFSCPVCMGALVVPCSTVCGHVFCEGCITASIKAQKKCPTCRKNLSMKSFHKVYLPTTN